MKIIPPKYSSYLEISKSALKNNIDYLRKTVLPKNAQLSCVVKGNAYGHGFEQIVQTHQKVNHIDHFSVFSAYEALKVKEALIKPATIMILGDLDIEYMPWAIENEIEFYVFDSVHLEQTLSVAKSMNKRAKIHIEVETGMNRTGFLMKNFKRCLKTLKANEDFLETVGLCTHYAGAESIANHIRVGKQIKKFKKFKDNATKAGVTFKTYHTACSAAALRLKNTRMDMLRIGILQFGFWPNTETYIYHRSKQKIDYNPLQRIISWKSKVMTVKSVKQGEYVGYGNAYFTNEDKLIAVIPVGYGNGYSRSLSNSARVLVKGEFAQVIGVVNMNAISIDITNIQDVEIGDEVVLIGKQGEQEISVSSFSEFTDQLNYEVLTRLPIDIPRHIVD